MLVMKSKNSFHLDPWLCFAMFKNKATITSGLKFIDFKKQLDHVNIQENGARFLRM